MREYSDLELKLRAECEKGFIVGEFYKPAPLGPGGARSATGEYYVELVDRNQKFRTTENEAYEAALQIFRSYANDKIGKLYWRVCPEIDFQPLLLSREVQGHGWVFYMRLLISDKPVVALASHEELR